MLRFFQNDKRDVLKYHNNFKFKKSAESVRSAGEKKLPQKMQKIMLKLMLKNKSQQNFI
jgi:hypothetical protein